MEFLRFSKGDKIIGVRRISMVSRVKVFSNCTITITFTWSCTKMSGS